jgi:hypothetical protein
MAMTEQRIPMDRHFRHESRGVSVSPQQVTLIKDRDLTSEQASQAEWSVVTRLQCTNKKLKGTMESERGINFGCETLELFPSDFVVR